MADKIISLPTAARAPVGSQTHRGKYPKGVIPMWKLRVARNEREDRERLALERKRDEQGKEEARILHTTQRLSHIFTWLLKENAQGHTAGVVVVHKDASGKELYFGEGCFERNPDALVAAAMRLSWRCSQTQQDDEE